MSSKYKTTNSVRIWIKSLCKDHFTLKKQNNKGEFLILPTLYPPADPSPSSLEADKPFEFSLLGHTSLPPLPAMVNTTLRWISLLDKVPVKMLFRFPFWVVSYSSIWISLPFSWFCNLIRSKYPSPLFNGSSQLVPNSCINFLLFLRSRPIEGHDPSCSSCAPLLLLG